MKNSSRNRSSRGPRRKKRRGGGGGGGGSSAPQRSRSGNRSRNSGPRGRGKGKKSNNSMGSFKAWWDDASMMPTQQRRTMLISSVAAAVILLAAGFFWVSALGPVIQTLYWVVFAIAAAFAILMIALEIDSADTPARSRSGGSSSNRRSDNKSSGGAAGKPARNTEAKGNGGARSEKKPGSKSKGSTKPKRKPEMVEVTSPRLYVGNLNFDASESDLFELFNGVGNVQNAEVVSNPYTHRSKGFAFVQMNTTEEAKRAVDELHNKDFMGRPLVVSGAKTPKNKGKDDGNNEEE